MVDSIGLTDKELQQFMSDIPETEIGKVVHYGVDLVLVSAFLAGVKRSTGLTPNLDSIESKDIKYYGNKYLDVGETVFDVTNSYFASSDYFKRK